MSNIIRNSLFVRVTAGVVAIATAMMMFSVTALPAQAQTLEDLQAQITQLLATIATLQSQVAALSGGGGGGTGFTFTQDLKEGNTGEDVRQLQLALNTNAAHQVAASGVGSPGNETSFFGSLTKAAVVAFQNLYASEVLTPLGLSAGTGYFGPSSRAKMNALMAAAAPPPPGPAPEPTPGLNEGDVTVSSPTQPANGLAPMNAARVPFTKVTFTAGPSGATVDSITVQRGGVSQNTDISGVVLLDEDGIQLGLAKTLNSNNRADLKEDFVISPNSSRTMTIGANMPSGPGAGNVVTLSVISVVTKNGVVSGALPITGAAHTVNIATTIGTATLQTSSLTNLSASEEIGTTDHVFAGIRVTAGSAENLRLRSIKWNQTGSASKDDLNNLAVEVGGTAYPVTVSSNGKWFTSVFGDGVVLSKGLATDVVIKGDIIDGPARTVLFDIDRATDIHVGGETFGFGLTPTQSANGTANVIGQQLTSGTPFYDANQVTINAGSFSSVSNSSALAPAQNVAINDPNAIMGAYQVSIVGEPITVGESVFRIGQATTSQSLTNVTIFDEDGNAIAGPLDVAASGVLTFSDSITYPTGLSRYLIRGNLSVSTGGWVTSLPVNASTTPSADWTQVTGDNTGNTIPLTGVGLVTMSTMTIRAAALTVSVSTLPPAQSVVSGSNQVEFARYIFDGTQSGEDVRVSNIPLAYDGTGTATDLTNCQLSDGGTSVTSGSNVVNPSAINSATASSTSFTFDGAGLTVTKNSSKTLSLGCDVRSGVTAVYQWGLDSGQQSAYTGSTGIESGQTVNENLTDSSGQKMTAAAFGSYTVTNDTSILYGVVQGGTSGVTLGAFRFEAGATEDVTVKQVALELGNTSSSSPADLVGQKVTLWHDGVQVGTGQLGSGANTNHATSTLSSPFTITKSESETLVIKGDLSPQNAIDGTPGAYLVVNYDGNNNGLNGNYATGAQSNVTIVGTSGDATTNGVRIFRTVPTVAVTSSGCSTCLQTGADLYQIRITAGSGRDIGLRAVSFNVTDIGLGASGFQLFGPSGAVNGTGVATTADSGLSGDRLRITFDPANIDRRVTAGNSKTYTLRSSAVVNLTSTNVETLSFSLLQDTGFPSITDLMGTVASSSANATGIEGGSNAASTTDRFIWTPFSTTTPTETAGMNSNLDWSNSYGLPGFPSVGQSFPLQSFSH